MRRVLSVILGNAALFSVLALVAGSTLGADSQGAWSVAGGMTTARTEILADTFNGKIYVAGGQTPSIQDSPMFQEFDPATKRWRDLAPMPRGASHPGVAALNGKIYVVGGFSATVHKNPLDQVL